MNENLSLYHIEQDLAELMAAREEELQAINEGTRKDADGLAAIDQAIKEYAAREVAKVDGIRGYLRWAKVQIEAAEEEAEKQAARAKQLKAGVERLKQFVVSVMQDAGKKSIEGKTGKLLVKGNGGLEPLVISDESLIPDDLCWVEGRIRKDLWEAIRDSDIFNEFPCVGLISSLFQLTRAPSSTLIREALARECRKCGGIGKYCGQCGFVPCNCPDALDAVGMAPIACETCAGTGRAGVPGAHLEARGVHLETR